MQGDRNTCGVGGRFSGGSDDKESACNAGDAKVLWRRKWQPTPVFLSGKSHGQGSLVVYHPRVHKESDMTEWLTHTHRHTWSNLGQLQTIGNLFLEPACVARSLCARSQHMTVFWINFYAEHKLHQKISNTNMVARSLDSFYYWNLPVITVII